jgi:hypothetical protein
MILICINSVSATRAHALAVVVNTRLGPAAKCPTCSLSWLLTTAEQARLATAKDSTP